MQLFRFHHRQKAAPFLFIKNFDRSFRKFRFFVKYENLSGRVRSNSRSHRLCAFRRRFWTEFFVINYLQIWTVSFISNEVRWNVQVIRRHHERLAIRCENWSSFVFTDVASQREESLSAFQIVFGQFFFVILYYDVISKN